LSDTDPPPRERLAAYRREHVPLYNENPLKLGLFTLNCSGGLLVSTLPTSWTVDWPYHRRVAQRADDLGFEFHLTVGRWRGFDGSTNYSGTNYETFTYAAAVAEATEHIMCISTIHAPVHHPIVAAKAGASIDHVSGGRYAMNVVMGWFAPELAMFGMTQRDHESRYEYGAEWIAIIDRLWRGERFDFDGRFFQLADAYSSPTTIQPRPPIINAGNSATGSAWATAHADFNFASFRDLDSAREYSARVKRAADHEHDRDLGVLTYAIVICRETEAEARAVMQRSIDLADLEGSRNALSILGIESSSFDHLTGPMAEFVIGGGAARIVGSPEQVVEQLVEISEAGLDGVAMAFVDQDEDLAFFGEKVMPLLREAGVRR
jgi:alkanesulfonate monooxygenase SsuD/methylene tetrahydromethanopterin reductase-like flavin-dependent oxidoreductase (luciferase family)